MTKDGHIDQGKTINLLSAEDMSMALRPPKLAPASKSSDNETSC